MQDKALSLLGIAKKAGRLAIGSEAAAISARQGKAHLIISASDASAGSVRRAKANAESAGTEYLAVPYTMFELGSITGRGSPGVVAILDKGLAESFASKLSAVKMPISEEEPDNAVKPETPRAAKESDV